MHRAGGEDRATQTGTTSLTVCFIIIIIIVITIIELPSSAHQQYHDYDD